MNSRSLIPAILAGWFLSFFATASQAMTITFDDLGLVHGDVISGVPGVFISAQNFEAPTELAVIFDTDSPADPDNDDDLRATFGNAGGNPDLNPDNILIVQEARLSRNPNILDGCNLGTCDTPNDQGGDGGQLTFSFNNDYIFESIDIYDIDEPGIGEVRNAVVRIFDNAILQATIPILPTGDNAARRVDLLNIEGDRVEVFFDGSGGLDNLTFIPIPASVWLFGSALFGLSLLVRRQRRI